MPDPLVFLKAIGASAIASATFVLMMVRARRHVSMAWENSACVLGMGFGLSIGFRVPSLRLIWPPVNGLDRLIMIVLPVALAIELIACFPRVPQKVAWFLRISLAVAIPRILLHDSVYVTGNVNGWNSWQSGTALVLCSMLLVCVWGLLNLLSQRSPGISIPFSLALTIQCAGLIVMMAGYIKGGAAAFPLFATVATTAIVARLTMTGGRVPAVFDPSAIQGIAVVGLFGLLFVGSFFGRLSMSSALTMLLTPLLCWATEISGLRSRNLWLTGSLRLVLVSIPLVVVLFIAKQEFDRKMAPLLGTVQTTFPAQ